MKKVSQILFPIDFSTTSNNAFRYALWFADKYGASIKMIHIVQPEVEPLDFPVMVAQATKQKMDAAKALMKSLVDTSLTQLQTTHQIKDIPNVQSDIKVGIPSLLISEIARQDDIDLIIMGTQGVHSVFDRLFGSVTTATIRNAPCSVLVIPEKVDTERISTVAYATDLLGQDPYHIWEVGKLLQPFNPILRVVHVENKPSESKLISMKDLETFFENRSPALQITYHNIASKSVKEELIDFAENWAVDLLVMYQPKRSFFDNIFHKSLIRQELWMTKVPLLILK